MVRMRRRRQLCLRGMNAPLPGIGLGSKNLAGTIRSRTNFTPPSLASCPAWTVTLLVRAAVFVPAEPHDPALFPLPGTKKLPRRHGNVTKRTS